MSHDRLSLEERLAHLLDLAREAAKIDRLHLWGLAPEGDRLLYVVGSGLSEEDRAALVVRPEFPLTGAGPVAKAIRDRAAGLVTDSGPRWRGPSIEPVAAKRFYIVPICTRGRDLGLLTADNKYSGAPLDAEALRLLHPFALHAAAEIDNARLSAELDARTRDLTQALEQQAATGEVLRSISSSTTHLHSVLHAVAKAAARVGKANDVVIVQTEGNSYRRAAYYSSGSQVVELPADERVPLRRDFVLSRAILDRGVVHVPDLLAESDEEYAGGKLYARRLGYRTNLAVPLLREGKAIGAIAMRRAEVSPFSDKQIELLKVFADQAVLAIENARLFSELQSRNRDLTKALGQQTATSEIFRVISGAPTDLQKVLDTLAESAARLCDTPDVTIQRADPDGETSTLVAHYGPVPVVLGDRYPIRADFITGRAFLERRVIHVDNILAEPAGEFPASAAYAVRYGYRTQLVVPLLQGGKAIGVFSMRRPDVRPFSDQQIALVRTFADGAVIAIENTRLFNELESRNRDLTESLERQTATSEILRVISQSQTDVQPVFGTIAASAQKLCRATAGSVYTYDGELLHMVTAHGLGPEALEAVRRAYPMPPSRGGAAARSILNRAVAHIPDVREDAEYRMQGLAQATGVRSALAVPMLREGSPIGAIFVYAAEPSMFSERQIAMLQTFADQAVIAIENTRLFNELQARTAELGRSVEELKALGEVGTAVGSTLDVDTVLTTIVTHAIKLAGTQAGVIYDYDETTEELRPRATSGYTEETADALRRNPLRKGEGVTGLAIAKRQPIQVPDIAAEGAYHSRVFDLMVERGLRAVLAVPLIREDQVMGALTVTRTQPGEFSPEVVNLLTTFASQSALAMQNARLFHQLEIASQHKSTFLANMSHELRTPLNAIIGYSEMLQEEAVDEGAEGLLPDLKRVSAAGKHLLELINSILDLSKIEAGKMELHLEDFDVAAMVEDIVAVIKPLAENNGNRLEVSCEASAGTMHADLTKVRQVLFNLLSNACKFTENGAISLTVEREGASDDSWLSFTVSDTGIGLTADQLGRLFQEFSQADASTTRKYGGTGLGLALSRRLSRLMGGDVSVTSEAGRGSRFTVRLPANVAQIAERSESGGRAHGGTVLVIDDEPPVRDLMRRFLGREGFRVLTAANGEDGLRLAREQHPDAITLDVIMPGMDGWTVLGALMADPELSDIPVIMLTIIDDKQMGYALGASGYLSKPIDRARLLSVLARYQRDLPVLVVDDDPAVRQVLRRALEADGYTVAEAENGRVALEALARGLPGLILLDLMMPELDGFGLVSALREREAWQAVPVVIITAKELTAEERAWLNGSVVRILEKGGRGQEALLSDVRDLVAASIGSRKRGGQ